MRLLAQPHAGLFADPGLGKTACMLAAFVALRKAHPKWKMLVIAPRHVAHNVWPAEVAKWSQFAHLRVVVLHGTKKDKLLGEEADIYVINPEGLAWLSTWRWAWPEVLCVDESTKFKHPNTARFRLLREYLGRFKRRYILTGKPVPNGITDLFGQIYILDEGVRLGRYITHFRHKYCYQTGFGGYKWVPHRHAEAEIQALIQPITLRLDKAEHLQELPRYLDNVVRVPLPPKARAQYDVLERDFVLKLKAGEVLALNAAAMTAKLRQMASGAVYMEEGDHWEEVHEAKLDALDALLSEREGRPTLIAYQFRHTAARLKGKYPKAVVLSDLTDTKARSALWDWDHGEIEHLLVHPASAAHGLNLQAGSEALVWVDPTYDLEHWDQLIARLWRQGQPHQVVVHAILATGTVDDDILTAVRSKDRSQNQFLAALKSRLLGA